MFQECIELNKAIYGSRQVHVIVKKHTVV